MIRIILVACAAALSCQSGVVAGVEWQPFHPLPGLGLEDEEAVCTRLSADGTVALGYITSAGGPQQYVVWRGGQPQLLPTNGSITGVHDLSGDGSVLVGTSYIGTTFFGSVWRYTDTGYQQHLVADLPGGGTFAKLYKVSRDGSRAIGVGRSIPARAQATYWNIGDGPNAPAHGLGYIPPWNIAWSEGNAISADGSIMAGSGRGNSGDLAFSTRLGELAAEPGIHGIEGASLIYHMSNDGRYMVGFSRVPGYNRPRDPTIWIDGVAMALGLPFAPQSGSSVTASFVSDDGSIIVGSGTIDSIVYQFVWVDLVPWLMGEYVSSLGVIPDDWEFLSGSFSSDGQYCFGQALDPDGRERAFVTTIPTPGALTLIAFALATASCRRSGRLADLP